VKLGRDFGDVWLVWRSGASFFLADHQARGQLNVWLMGNRLSAPLVVFAAFCLHFAAAALPLLHCCTAALLHCCLQTSLAAQWTTVYRAVQCSALGLLVSARQPLAAGRSLGPAQVGSRSFGGLACRRPSA